MSGHPHLPDELFKYDFIPLLRREKHVRVYTRLLGITYLQEGKTYSEVARLLKVEVSAPQRWVKRLVAGGLAGLQEQPGRGRKRLLAKAQEVQLQEAVEQ